MSLAPDILDLLTRARGDLRMGLFVVLKGVDYGVMTASAETLGPERFDDVKNHSTDLSIVITQRRAATLKTAVYDGDIARLTVPDDADTRWMAAIADPANDLQNPMKGPLRPLRGGSVNLHRLSVALMKYARLLPAAVVATVPDPVTLAQRHGLTLIDAVEATPRLESSHRLRHVASANLPIAAAENGRLYVFRSIDDGEEHYAIEIGKPSRQHPALVRVHSACFTGDILDSLKCDCGPQLRAALAQMGQERSGILIYLNQEGRGIGLANKMRAYSLQDQGYDTVEANHRLGFEDDERDFRLGSDILKTLGHSNVRLLTNNPEKVEVMIRNGINVSERIPIHVGQTCHNRAYLSTKMKKSGHIL